MNRKRWMILGGAGIVLLVAGGITAAVLYLNSEPKIPSKEEIQNQDPLTTAQYIASEDFANLPDDQKQEYLDTAMSDQNKRREMFALRDKLSDSERQQLRRNMRSVGQQQMQKRMQKRVDEYCKLPPGQRDEYLDKMIDQMEERRANRPPRDPNRERQRAERQARDTTGQKGESSANSRRRRGPRAERMKRRIEGSTPAERAKRTQFRMDMRARMKARGIEPRHHRRRRR